jgi:hypothetical protein
MFSDLAADTIVPVQRSDRKGGTMSRRKMLTLASLALAVAALSPASAVAKAGGADRPVKDTGSGTVSINVQTGAVTGDFTGVATHGGEYTGHLEATITAATPEGVVVEGTQTIVADNGDQITGDVTITGPGTTTAHQTTGIMTVTGGTGRFADASGTITTTSEATPFSFDGVTLLEHVEYTGTGEISY